MKTKQLLSELNYQPKKMIYGDGYKGLPTYAPFDKVIVTAGAPFVPEALLEQLKVGGILVIPVGTDVQVMKRIIKLDVDNYKEEEHGLFQFVPLLGDKANGLK